VNDTHAIIPVAGFGQRLRPHTHSAPKALLHVAGKPILAHILDELVDLGISRLTLIVGYRGEMIRDYVTAKYNFQTEFVEQREVKGPGHAISLTREATRGAKRLLIIYGDTVFKADMAKVLASPDSLIGVKKVQDPHRFGIVDLQDDIITRMEEKPKSPKSDLAIVGIYYLTDPDCLYDCLDEMIAAGKTVKGEFYLTEALQMMIERNVVLRPFPVDGWYDCGLPEALLETNREMLNHLAERNHDEPAREFPGCIIRPPVSIAPTATLETSIIGPHVTVADHAVIKNAVVSDSIISRRASVSNILLAQSIISDNARVESRFNCLNVGDSSEVSLG
jgi:glucose-1-phosphate thymidylyltransferase